MTIKKNALPLNFYNTCVYGVTLHRAKQEIAGTC